MTLQNTGEGWVCPECGDVHQGLITCFGPNEPVAWQDAPLLVRLTGRRAKSFCSVKVGGVRQHFVRGHLPIQIHGYQEHEFLWNVWVRVSHSDFRGLLRTLNDADRVDAPAVLGLLDTALPYEEPTEGLPVEVHNRPPGEVPYVRLAQTVEHPLQKEQAEGMSVHRLEQLNRELLA